MLLSLAMILLGCSLMTQNAYAQSKALDLSAAGNMVKVPNYAIDLTPGNAITIQLDVKFNTASSHADIITMNTSDISDPFSLFYTNSHKIYLVRGDGVSNTNNIANVKAFTPTIGQWYNFSAVIKKDTALLYIDGVLDTTLYTTNPNYNYSTIKDLYIGSRSDGWADANAVFDNVRIWTVEKSQVEIDSLRKVCVDGSDANLSLLYNFDEGSGTIAHDLALSDGAQDGTIIGSVAWAKGTLGSSRSSIFPTLCTSGNYISPSGNIYTMSGTYMDTIANQYQCDSIITIQLAALPEIKDKHFVQKSYTFCDSGNVNPQLLVSDYTVNYTFQDKNYNNIEGPLAGNGDTLNFSSFGTNQNSSYHVKAEKTYIDSAYNSLGTNYAKTGNTALFTENITFEAWIKNATINSAWNGIVSTSSATSGFIQLGLNGSGKLRAEINGSNGYTLDGNTLVEDGNWHFVALTNSQDTMKLYVDGQLDAFFKWPTPMTLNTNKPINIASQRYDGAATKAVLDNVSIWGEERSATQIKADMNTYFSGNETNLIAYYTFDNMTPTSIMDMTGSHPATIAIGVPLKEAGVRENTSCSLEMMDSIKVVTNKSTSGIDTQSACASFQWIDGNTYTSSNNTATYVVQNVAGCDSTITLHLTIKNVDITTTNNNSPILEANANNATYQWINCATNTAVSDATNKSFTAITNGSYAVIVTQNGCSDTSACITVGNVSVADVNFEKILKLYPNPTSGEFVIDLGSTYQSVQITISNILGQVISAQNYVGTKSITTRINNEIAGVYLVNIKVDNKSTVFKVVKE